MIDIPRRFEMRFKSLLLILALSILLIPGGIAQGECDRSDGNNDQDHAQPIGLQEVVEGVVCPEDPFDFYTFDVFEGDAVSGIITLDAEREGATLRIEGDVAGRIFDGSASDYPYDIEAVLTSDELVPDTYYVRVYHWQVFAVDHEYTLTMDLTLSGCFPDGNEEPENATEIEFGARMRDWICPEDRLDVYHFVVDTNLEGQGYVGIELHSGFARLYVYGAEWNEIARTSTINGDTGMIDYDFTSYEGGRLPHGDYYIGVFLPLSREDATKYDLVLTKGEFTIATEVYASGPAWGQAEEEDGGIAGLHIMGAPALGKKDDSGMLPMLKTLDSLAIDRSYVPWPNIHCYANNAGYTNLSGPSRDEDSFERWLPLGIRTNNYRGLLVGKDHWVYFMSRPDNYLYAVKTDEEDTSWRVQTGSDKPACLDNKGYVYYIHEDGDRLIRAAGNNNVWAWSRMLPQGGSRSVELVGQNVYTSTVISEPESYICAYSKDGELLWNEGPFEGRMTGIGEDGLRSKVYIQTSRCLYQLGFDGTQNWFRRFPVMDEPSNIAGAFAPIIGKDGHIWTFYPETRDAITYTKDGEIAGMLMLYDEGWPRSVILDVDNKVYISTGYKIMCYENWNELVWEFDPSATYSSTNYWFRDIVMDGRGWIYTWYQKEYQPPDEERSWGHIYTPPLEYSDWWLVLDPVSGAATHTGGRTLLSFSPAGPPGLDPISGTGEIAIGDDQKMFLLHFGGEFHWL
jgi:hypothetical protein